MGRNLDPIWIDTFFFCNGRKTTISNIQHPFGKLSLLFRIGCHDSHVDMKMKNCNMLTKMRWRQRSTNNVFSSSLGNNRQDPSKSPPKTTVFPPKIFSVAYASSNCIKSCRVRSTASKVRQCIIGASSQMIRSALRTNLATFIYCVMLQVDSSCRSIGILNLEWMVLSPRSKKDAVPDEATASTIFPCPCRRDRNVVQTNVLSIPPLPYTKNNLPSLFVMTFKIVLYALRWSSLNLSSTLSASVVNEC